MSLPRKVEAVVFDMDGLLVDSERVFRDSMMTVSRQRGFEMPLAVFNRMIGAPREQNRQVALEHFGADFDHDAWHAAVTEHAHAQMAADLSLKAGVVELLDDLDRWGLPYAVCTSSSPESVERQLKGLVGRFAAIVARGDYPRGKPNPDPFLIAAGRLGVEPAACLALEDSHNGVRAAHAAGMMTIMVPDLLEATQEIRTLTIAIAETLHDVRGLVAEQHPG